MPQGVRLGAEGSVVHPVQVEEGVRQIRGSGQRHHRGHTIFIHHDSHSHRVRQANHAQGDDEPVVAFRKADFAAGFSGASNESDFRQGYQILKRHFRC